MSFNLEGIQFRWLKVKGIHPAFFISIMLIFNFVQFNSSQTIFIIGKYRYRDSESGMNIFGFQPSKLKTLLG